MVNNRNVAASTVRIPGQLISHVWQILLRLVKVGKARMATIFSRSFLATIWTRDDVAPLRTVNPSLAWAVGFGT